MAIDFTLSTDQKDLQLAARDFAENVLAPVVREADREPDALKAFQLTKPAYIEAYRRGLAFGMLPKEYGGGGVTNIELILAAEEICAVDPGFACTLLVNGLALLPVWYWGSEEQKRRVMGAATSDSSGEWIAGYAASEPPGTPGGTANFDSPAPHPAGIGVTARRDGDSYVLNGRKYWPCNVGGWDGQGANINLVVVRTDPSKGGTEGLSAILVERGAPGVTYNIIDSFGHRLTPNSEIIFEDARIPAENLVEGTYGNGDLLINRNFAWSGPVAGIAAVGVARAAYEAALSWSKTYTAGASHPMIHFQNVGYVLGDVAAKIEACRYFCWKAAHYIDQHGYHGELIGAMNKVFCTELLFDSVYKCMQVVGVNSADKKHMFEKYLREAAIFPIYDGGNFGMQRRRVHGVLASPTFNPRALMDNEFVHFVKDMEMVDTVQRIGGDHLAPA
ncbi:acyl-CoA dehydrogenase family protein [Pseudonocardia asaccharolytica]|uniref:Acyl-CoA dehydrogenase n=1 Tax=Pseudonocardia asaccharolytica DSM 44247 = NBRC 16224 TaxID=1123024 RepID=A0A511D275_9PSEU|nr:acyl-CoA dehydrogenase family protein [Pseudonocardia asaccharolytica]GEL18901.1 acyl-CoA dehydrogenase [Pseudonocardia asaccharolytica DSM 44247 = NBRC 16224]